MVGLGLSYLCLIVSEIHEGAIKVMCLFRLVVFQVSSFLLTLEMKAAIRADTRYNVFAVLFGISVLL